MFQKFCYRKPLWMRGGGEGGREGVSRFCVQRLLSHCAQKTVGEPFGISEKFGERKVLCIRGMSRYSVEIVFVSVPQNIVAEHFCVSEAPGSE